jgi:peroxiredoxin Q/BCP
MAINVGDKAPSFTLPNQDGAPVSLQGLLEKAVVVLYFYPKDHTLGCTIEAQTFRDSYGEFQKAGAEVVGISSQSCESHRSFADKNQLPFTLVADLGGEVRKLYGVPKAFGLQPGRVTYVIDRKGVVRNVFASALGFKQHAREALEVLKRLQ